MKVEQDKVVTIRYTLEVEGEVLDQGELSYLHGHQNIIQGLEEALEGREEGEVVQAQVAPEKGYGPHDPEGVQVVPLSAFPEDAEVVPGAQFYAQDMEGNPMPLTVVAVEGEEVTIDFNHPLAGKTLDFQVEILKVRPATPEELEHGHVHEGGHSH
ncbi:FKBP-type peptidyl-prolyl cis-trans isomerase [Thermus filiformis]|jgi:FKBP-type peptidyl-prolyl cis-trans isomerase SlyD|uniref:Peptidyl-prolyl cis-trans isomerase n=1 Tax=Thermus filiformis TaxID=276 RepID=A0A0A2WQ37_THEFI|nr:peptidylprolyl isomerase [Thermus filiformis]KGQ22266.1 peptidylprolyl isomerase [Thermus filiformis]